MEEPPSQGFIEEKIESFDEPNAEVLPERSNKKRLRSTQSFNSMSFGPDSELNFANIHRTEMATPEQKLLDQMLGRPPLNEDGSKELSPSSRRVLMTSANLWDNK